MNTFINLVKKSLIEGGTRGGIGAFKEIRALIRASLLLALNSWTGPWPANLSCSLVRLARGMMQGLRRPQDPGAIAMEI